MASRMFEIIFDSSGGMLLQVGARGYVHHYDYPSDLANDALALLMGASTDGWENHQPEYRRDAAPGEQIATSARIAQYLRQEFRPREHGHAWNDFWTAITPQSRTFQRADWMAEAVANG